MKHTFRSLYLLWICTAGFVAASVATANASTANYKNILADSIPVFAPDTSYYLRLPLAVRQDSVPVEPSELIQDRLACLQQQIPLHFNPYVRAHIDYFTIRNRKYSRRVLERQQVYFPLFEKYLAQYNLPDELKYLSVVESALLPRAVSSAKAVGLWQFMTPTARDFNLKQNDYLDERMDPEKSTIAACKFLNQLYRIFGDWELAMAAYNCGPGNVKKAIARAGGGKRTFWEIFPYLPKETRGYVPTFTALVYTMNHAPEHEIFPDTVLYAVPTDTVLINHSLDLAKLSVQLELQEDALAKLNPAVRKAVLPETVRNFPLKVPAHKRETLAQNRTAMLDSARIRIITPAPPAMLADVASLNKTALTAPPADSTATDSLVRMEYVVQKGDFLHRIAQKNNVTVAQLKAWNQLYNAVLSTGQKLVWYQAAADQAVPTGTTQETTATVSSETKPDKTSLAAISATNRQLKQAKKIAQQVKQIHAVQPGDTLWNISKRYQNVPVEQIKKLNKLKTNEIKPGQKLVIS